MVTRAVKEICIFYAEEKWFEACFENAYECIKRDEKNCESQPTATTLYVIMNFKIR